MLSVKLSFKLSDRGLEKPERPVSVLRFFVFRFGPIELYLAAQVSDKESGVFS